MKKLWSLCLLSTLAAAPAAFSAPTGTLSVHILNQQTGMPSAGVSIVLAKQAGTDWQQLATAKTDQNGRVTSLYPQNADMDPGVYRVTFETILKAISKRVSFQKSQ